MAGDLSDLAAHIAVNSDSPPAAGLITPFIAIGTRLGAAVGGAERHRVRQRPSRTPSFAPERLSDRTEP
jgi:hypothetical protein